MSFNMTEEEKEIRRIARRMRKKEFRRKSGKNNIYLKIGEVQL